MVMHSELEIVSSAAAGKEKWCEEAYSPEFTESQNVEPSRALCPSPVATVVARDQLITMVMNSPIVSDVTAMAQPTS
jgi:hypothetical protein